jgi:PAS domain S-box-containing protein
MAYLLIGFYTLLRDLRRPTIIFFLWCMTSSAVYLVSAVPPFDLVGKGGYLLEESARILLAPLTLHLFTIFPRPLQVRARNQRAIPFFYLPAAFLLLLQFDLIAFNGKWLLSGQVGPALVAFDRLELLHLGIFALLAVGVLVWRLRSRPEPETTRQMAWIALGMLGGYLPFLTLYVVPLFFGIWGGPLISAIAVVPLALVPITFAWAILRYKLWDIGLLVRDTVALGLTVLIGVVGFSLANLTINRLLPDQLAEARDLVSFLSGLMIAGVLVPARRGIGTSLERLQYRHNYSKRRALADFGKETLHETDLKRLCKTLSESLSFGLGIPEVGLYLNHRGVLVEVLANSDRRHELVTRDLEDGFWEVETHSLSGVGLPMDIAGSLHQLYAQGYRYAFPLALRDKHLGILATGYKDEEVPLNSDDLDLIRNLLNQATLAIDNAELLDEVHHQLDEVLRLQSYNQGIIDSSPAGIAVIDSNHQVLSANDAFAELIGVQTDQILGQQLLELLRISELPLPEERLREIKYFDHQGNERYGQVSTALLQGGDERKQLVIVQDVGDRVAMENTLREQERLASLGMLAAGVAHEVNTPITGISSYAQMLLADTATSDPRYDLLKKVEKQTFRAARIVNSLLDFARNRPSEQADLSLVPVLEESLSLLSERVAEAGLSLSWDPPAGEDLLVWGNETELQQVFTNLVINAIDAMKGTDAAISVSMNYDAQWISTVVEDSGPGIPSDDLENIFQPFYSTKLAEGGTGLGLSISFNIIRHHGGQIRVVSQPGEGSQFIVELPRHHAAGHEKPK